MLTFPTALFTPSTITPELVGAAVAGGASLSGLTQYSLTTGGGYWKISLGEAILWNPTKMKTWRAIAAISDNGATPFIVPLCDRLHQAFLPGDIAKGAGVGNSDDTHFSDGATWESEYVTASITGSAALRSTTLTIAISGAATLQGGEFFTIWHSARGQRLYEIVQVLSQGDGAASIVIRPPLRQATPDGITLDFDNPRCQMNVVGSMAPVLEQLRFGSSPKIQFVENFLPVGS